MRGLTDPAKLTGLRQLLARDGRVTFKATGAVVERDPEHPADLLVWLDPLEGGCRRVSEHAHDQLAQAYAIAITEPEPEPPPVAKVKPTRSRTDFGECPF